MHYNLLDEKWIPVLYLNGEYKRVGIRQALVESGKIREITASNPLDRVALLRFLLAVLIWCKNDAKSALATLPAGAAEGVPDDWLTKLEEYKAAFNLLGDGERFYQDTSLKGKEARRPIADLLVEFPGADSVNHMRHIVHDDSYGFCPACCVLGILRLSVWAPANRFYPASVNPATAAYAVAEGQNLLMTLVANLPATPSQDDQAPWLLRVPPDSPGTLAYLAWRPRRLWLNVAREQGYCASCASSGVLITSLCNECGWPTPTTGGQQFAKAVEAEMKKLGYNPKGKDQANKSAIKLVRNASLIRTSRMDELRKAVVENNPACAAGAQTSEIDEHGMARMFDTLISKVDKNAIKSLTRKATADEQSQLGDGGTKTKKFWDGDPQLLGDGEAISLPGLGADAGQHSSRFWRNAMRLHHGQTRKVVATGPVVNKFTFQDASSIDLPDTCALTQAKLSEYCSGQLPGILKQVTRNPDRQHPEINAAIVMLTPHTEARIRSTLSEPKATADDAEYLHDIYDPVVAQLVASTICGSPLQRQAIKNHAQALLSNKIKELVGNEGQPPASADTSEAPSAKPKRRGKKKESGT